MTCTNQMLNILTWNATGNISRATYLCDCLNQNKIDICGISHRLYEKDLHFLSQKDNAYKGYTVSDFDLKRPSYKRVGKGEVAVL